MSNTITSPDILLKHPDDVVNYSMDFSNVVNSDASITDYEISFDIEGLSVTNDSISDKLILFTVSGGIGGKNYRIHVKITSSNGEILIGEGLLKVRNN